MNDERNALIEELLPLSKRNAKRFVRKNEDYAYLLDELISVGNLKITEIADAIVEAKEHTQISAYVTKVLRRMYYDFAGRDSITAATPATVRQRIHRAKKIIQAGSQDKAVKTCVGCFEPHLTSNFYRITDRHNKHFGLYECAQSYEDRIRRETREEVYVDIPDDLTGVEEDFEYQDDCELTESEARDRFWDRMRECCESERQSKGIKLRAEGKNDRAISEELNVSSETVRLDRKQVEKRYRFNRSSDFDVGVHPDHACCA